MENININKHMYFDTTYGKFFLTHDTGEMIYRQKGLICSYSGANEWIHHFTCEMLDFYSGKSIYNYALNSYRHKDELAKIFKEDKDVVINFINASIEESWGKKMYKTIENIIDEA